MTQGSSESRETLSKRLFLGPVVLGRGAHRRSTAGLSNAEKRSRKHPEDAFKEVCRRFVVRAVTERERLFRFTSASRDERTCWVPLCFELFRMIRSSRAHASFLPASRETESEKKLGLSLSALCRCFWDAGM